MYLGSDWQVLCMWVFWQCKPWHDLAMLVVCLSMLVVWPQANCSYIWKINIPSVPLSASLLLFLNTYIEKEVKWEAQMGTGCLPVMWPLQRDSVNIAGMTDWSCDQWATHTTCTFLGSSLYPLSPPWSVCDGDMRHLWQSGNGQKRQYLLSHLSTLTNTFGDLSHLFALTYQHKWYSWQK